MMTPVVGPPDGPGARPVAGPRRPLASSAGRWPALGPRMPLACPAGSFALVRAGPPAYVGIIGGPGKGHSVSSSSRRQKGLDFCYMLPVAEEVPGWKDRTMILHNLGIVQ